MKAPVFENALYIYGPPLTLYLTKIRPKNNFSNLAVTFDHDLQMTRNWYGSKALVKAHLFGGVSSKSEHFPKIALFDETAQTSKPDNPSQSHTGGGVPSFFTLSNLTRQKCKIEL